MSGGWRIAGAPDGAVPIVGATYDVQHSRKGRFRIRATAVRGEWLDGVVVAGRARAMLPENACDVGDHCTIRDRLAVLSLVDDAKGAP